MKRARWRALINFTDLIIWIIGFSAVLHFVGRFAYFCGAATANWTK